MSLRKLHHTAALFIFIPLLSTTITGILYQFAKLWLGIPKGSLSWLMKIHQLSLFGPFFKLIYAPLLACTVLFMIFSGLSLSTQHFKKLPSLKSWSIERSFRNLHYNLSVLLWIPFAWIAICGGGYRLLKSWFGLNVTWLLDLHQGKIGLNFEFVFPVIVGILLVAIIVTGISMNSKIRNAFKQKQSTSNV